MDQGSKVSIRPGVSILSVLRHLNYTYWFALAEFIDNAIQSHIANQGAIEKTDGSKKPLVVSITINPEDGGEIIVRDNASGIARKDFSRAFRPAAIPPDNTGLSEFGMGMKSAACWCAKLWRVKTKHFDDEMESVIDFDVPEIVDKGIESVDVVSYPAVASSHYTEIKLTQLHKIPRAGAIARIREYLTSIYRTFLRSGLLRLEFHSEPLNYIETVVLTAPFYRTPSATALQWRKDIDFDFGSGLKVSGFAALRARASTSKAGFVLFRRGRVIQGGADDGYRPEDIFGKSNSYTYQRLFGELYLEGFAVSHTKDGFQWDENEEPFIDLLIEHLESGDKDLLAQAEGYRVRTAASDLKPVATAVATNVATTLQESGSASVSALQSSPVNDAIPELLPAVNPIDLLLVDRVVELSTAHTKWSVSLQITNDAAADLIEVSDVSPPGRARSIRVRMTLAHPFIDQFVRPTKDDLEPVWRVAVAIAIGETIARDSGGRAGAVRKNMNDLLKNSLSKKD